MTLKFVGVSDAKTLLKPGWLLQYRGDRCFSPWIRLATGGVHTHSAMYVGDWEVAEVRECVGGRLSPLEVQVRMFPGRIDVFSFNPAFCTPPSLGVQASDGMRLIAARAEYAYSQIAHLALRRLPIVFAFFDPLSGVTDDGEIDLEKGHWHCSDSVAAAYQSAGIDPVPFVPNRLVTPHDLTRSLLFRYEFTLTR